jgi:hypothetical protein
LKSGIQLEWDFLEKIERLSLENAGLSAAQKMTIAAEHGDNVEAKYSE